MISDRRIPVRGSVFGIPDLRFTVLDCATCAQVFAITDELHARRLWDRANFWCPLGHANVYCGGEKERLEGEVQELERRVTRLNAEVDQERARAATATRSANATRGEMTKLRKRIANGVCPACHRTFSQLARHMKSKHPQEVTSDD